eukprot:3152378-Pleurochrysis_carterae.AAC.4
MTSRSTPNKRTQSRKRDAPDRSKAERGHEESALKLASLPSRQKRVPEEKPMAVEKPRFARIALARVAVIRPNLC